MKVYDSPGDASLNVAVLSLMATAVMLGIAIGALVLL